MKLETYTLQEAADALKISKATLTRRIEAGLIEAVNLGTPKKAIYRIAADAMERIQNGIDKIATGKKPKKQPKSSIPQYV